MELQKQILRDYQLKTVNDAVTLVNKGKKRIVIVSPTGSGKSVMAQDIARRLKEKNISCMILSHRKEIRDMLSERLGIFSETVQSLTNRSTEQDKIKWKVKVLLIDECHHYTAPQWKAVFDLAEIVIGFTATPVQSSGEPLGNLFEEMIVAAHYPELVRRGFLVPTVVFRPDSHIGMDLARPPVKAYQEHALGQRAFLYASSVEESMFLSQQFNEAGIASAHVDAKTPDDDRKLALEMFRNFGVKVLCNVNIYTEGLDVPEASCCIIARRMQQAHVLLQATGRVLRPHPSKKFATIIDLPGVTHLHGLPLERRQYSLERGIEAEVPRRGTVTDCPQCAWCGDSATKVCPQCGFDLAERNRAKAKRRKPTIRSQQLLQVYSGGDTGDPLEKQREWNSLCSLVMAKGYSMRWALGKFKERYLCLPDMSQKHLHRLYSEIETEAAKKGYKRGWIDNVYAFHTRDGR
jgi:superfamily II DNA or RNA helicase